MRFSLLRIGLPLSLLALTACGEEESVSFAEGPAAAAHASAQGMPPGGSAPRGANMPQAPPVLGKILEAFDSTRGNYTYVKLELRDGTVTWAAGPRTELSPGQWVGMREPLLQRDFETQSKMGKVPEIFLARELVVMDEADALKVASTIERMNGVGGGGVPPENVHPTSRPTEELVAKPGEIPLAEGGMRIAEIHAQRESIEGQTVRVRGKVVRSARLLGGSWVHLQDGSGSAERGDHDLTVILPEPPESGSIIEVTGKVILSHPMATKAFEGQAILESGAVVGK